jgi:hypothetical protein
MIYTNKYKKNVIDLMDWILEFNWVTQTDGIVDTSKERESKYTNPRQPHLPREAKQSKTKFLRQSEDPIDNDNGMYE